MPTINTATIENFDSMTAEQKVEALLKVEVPEAHDMSKYVEKSIFDKKASEAAELSKKLKEALDEDGKKKLAEEEAKAADAQKYADLEAKYNEILKKSTISEYKAKYLAQGYDESLAEDTAKALESGDMSKVFENAEKYKTALEAKIKADLMDNTPKPNGGAGGNGNPVVEQAKNIGKAKAEANKASADVLKHYGI